jgi:hypothetical protein
MRSYAFVFTVIIVLSFVLFSHTTADAADPSLAIVVDHTCVDITAIPQAAIEQAKANLHIAYGHTSHGSQLITGMDGLIAFANGGGKDLSLPNDIFIFNNGGTSGALDLREGDGYGSGDMDHDCGYYPNWVNETIEYLGIPNGEGRGSNHPEINVIIWSWCGQVSGQTEQTMIDQYLAPMSQLEVNYPGVAFVYMTGHLDGTGETGNLHLRNQQIRDYCIANNKILYDFADIESYDPDQLVNYMPLLCLDTCEYDSDGNGSRDRNWATEWQGSHVMQSVGVPGEWYNCSPAHTEALNGNQKAYAAWWLWAHLGGWEGFSCLPAPSNLTADANSSTQQITLNWTDNSHDPNNEDYFIIQRQVDSGSWNNNYDTVPTDVNTYTDSSLAYGTYRYRIVAHSTSSCDSPVSNTAIGVISSNLPNAPSSLNSSVIGSAVNLTWTDNSNNEESFILERRVDSGAFAVLAGSIPANTENYNDSTTAPLHTYTYRIKAHNSFGDSDYSNETSQYIYGETVTVRLQTTAEVDDAFLRSAYPNTNYGSTSYLDGPIDNYIVKFNFPPALTNAKIVNAEIAFYGWQQVNWLAGQYMDLYRVSTEWAEMTTTWNIADTGQPWATPGGDAAELLGQVELTLGDHIYYPPVDVTDIVQKWVNGTADNFGMLLVNDSLTRTNLKASEYSSSHTYLEITYTNGCPCVMSGDINYDCAVDGLDYAILADNWMTENAISDIAPAPTGDGFVDIDDLAAFCNDWLTECQ